MDQLLIDGHQKYKSGKLRESAAQYLKYIETWAQEERNSVLSGIQQNSLKEKDEFENVKLILKKLDVIYEDLKHSAAALPPVIQSQTPIQRVSIKKIPQKAVVPIVNKISDYKIKIPFSPLTRVSIQLAKTAIDSILKLNISNPSINALKNPPTELINDAKFINTKNLVVKSKLLNIHLSTIESKHLLDLDPEILAREIARIDSSLFLNAILFLNKDRGSHLKGNSNTPLKDCADFACYLEHAIAQQILAYVSFINDSASNFETQDPDSPKDDNSSLNETHPLNIIDQNLVTTALILFECYHDYNGAISITRALMRPEIVRIRMLLSNTQNNLVNLLGKYLWCLPTKKSNMLAYEEIENQNIYVEYLKSVFQCIQTPQPATKLTKNVLFFLSDIYNFNQSKSPSISNVNDTLGTINLKVILYMPFHIMKILKIYSENSPLPLENFSIDALLGESPVISGPGNSKLKIEMEAFNICFSVSETDPNSISVNHIENSLLSSSEISRPSSVFSKVSSARLKIQPLIRIKHSGLYLRPEPAFYSQKDISIQHWILTRPYLTTNQLRNASFTLVEVSSIDESLQWFDTSSNLERQNQHSFLYQGFMKNLNQIDLDLQSQHQNVNQYARNNSLNPYYGNSDTHQNPNYYGNLGNDSELYDSDSDSESDIYYGITDNNYNQDNIDAQLLQEFGNISLR
ncbi:hypothetical protein BB560_001393 [Smittium megazygosporum]|uniref:Uncharacterized protein n=1 Tax=Smittium megazygosporum TaxID=133381 RepID=A0A2T9ZHW8_9FUNG|nr:hypothetical protein BB560_001393 [Smittium megazygosporum]